MFNSTSKIKFISTRGHVISSIYTAAHCRDSNYTLFFENSNIARLEATQNDELERPPLNEECFLILKQCSKNKTQGTDGLSVEFYLRLWSLLGEEMVQSLNYAYEHGQLNITQKQGIIKVTPKKGKISHSSKTGDS